MNENGQALGLKWHKFLVYFALWAGAIFAIPGAIAIFSGLHYLGAKDRIYEVFPSMQMVDMAYAAAIIAIAVYCIYVRYQLAGFKKGAPGKLLAMHVLSAAAPVAYAIAVSVISGVSLDAKEILITLVGAVIGFLINKIYYGHRADLFVN